MRTFSIETSRIARGVQYWTAYDPDVPTMADGNERLIWLKTDQPERSFRLIEVLNHTEDMEVPEVPSA